MTEPVEKKSPWFPEDMSFRLNGTALYSLETTATSAGAGFATGFDIGKEYHDMGYRLGFDFASLYTDEKLTADKSTVESSSHLAILTLSKISKDPLTYGYGNRMISTTSASRVIVGGGWQNVGGGSEYVGGESYAHDSNSWNALYLASGHRWGMEFFLPDSRIAFEPWLGYQTGMFFPLASLEERGNYASSPIDILLEGGVSLAYSDKSLRQIQNNRLTVEDKIHAGFVDGIDMARRIAQYYLYDAPTGRGKERLEEMGFAPSDTDQQTEDLRLLLMVDALSIGIDTAEFISFCYKAGQGENKVAAGIRTGERFASGIASVAGGAIDGGEGGVNLTTKGVSDLIKAGSGALAAFTNLDMIEVQKPIVAGASAVIQIGGALLNNIGVSLAGFTGMISETLDPDHTNSGLFKSSFSIKPYTIQLMGRGDVAASIEIGHDLKLSKSLKLALETEIETHAFTPANVGARADNATGGNSPYNSLASATKVRTGPTLKIDPLKGYLVPSVGIHTLQQFDSDITAGGGGSIGLETGVSFKMPVIKKKMRWTIGGEMVAEKAAGRPASISVGPKTGLGFDF